MNLPPLDGVHSYPQREAVLLSRVAELEEHAAGLEATIEHLVETVPECKPVILAYITEKLKINLT